MKVNFSTIPKSYMSFKSSNRCVYQDKTTKSTFDTINYDSHRGNCCLLYSNHTHFFRDDLVEFSLGGWVKFRKFITGYFYNAPKVNVYDFASSDGSEAYSLAISLIEELGQEKAEKFFPIKAYDFDSAIVKLAKSGVVLADVYDDSQIQDNTNENLQRYFVKSSNPDDKSDLRYILKPKEILTSQIDFNVADFVEEIDKVEPSNSLIMCRNFWPYMSPKKREEALDKLFKRIDPTSLVVIGSYDFYNGICREFREKGFQCIDNLIYKKGK